ncbi:MAG: hypothetical protein R2780_06815 [Crocinitomicaceae bacterium]|nr:hypothetical protein [Crocinitomicaceae bacterium]
MNKILLFIFCVVGALGLAQSNTAKKLKYFDSGMIFFERDFPGNRNYNRAGVPNYNVMGMEGEFLSIKKNKWRWKQKITGDIGGRKTDDLISNIEFEGGYLGGFRVWSNRFSTSLGSVVAYQPNPKLEIGIPLMFCARMTSEVGSYYLYEGQNIDPNDQTSAHDANNANRILINRKWIPGFKTGCEMVAFPNSEVSFVFRFNYQYFGWRDVYDVSTAKLIPATNEIIVNNTRVWNTSEWGFSIGLRYYFIEVRKSRSEPKQKKEDDPNVILTPKKRQ